MRKKNSVSERYKSFNDRFLSLIDLKGKKYWGEQLNVQPNLVWGWYHGRVPTMEYVLMVLDLSGASANWLFLGIGPKFLNDTIPTQTNSLLGSEREKIQEEFYLNNKKLIAIKNEANREIENLKKNTEIANMLKLLENFSNTDEDMKLKPIDIVSKMILPMLSFFNKYGEKMASEIENYATSQEAEILLKKLINFIKWIKKN